MITKEVREWLQKVERKQYAYNDAISEFIHLVPFLTKEEMKMIKRKLEETYR